MTLFKNFSRNLDQSINMALVNRGLLALYGHEEILKNLFPWNRLSDFEIISQECFMGDPFQKLFVKFWSVHKHGSGEWGFLALYGQKEILKSLILRNSWSDFEIISQKCSSDLNKKRNFDPSLNTALVNVGFFHYTDMNKFLKNLLWNQRSYFEIIEMLLGWPFSKSVGEILIRQ